MSDIISKEVAVNEIEPLQAEAALEENNLDEAGALSENASDAVTKGLRKLNPKYKTKAERKAERAALSEVEHEGYVPEAHESAYKVYVDKRIYANNYALSLVLLALGIVIFPYSKVGTALLWFYGFGTAWMVYSAMKLTIHVDGTTFRLEGAGKKKDGTYSFDEIEKIIYGYNKKEQRRYQIYKDGHKLFEIAPGSINGRWLYDDMIAYGVPGGLYQRL